MRRGLLSLALLGLLVPASCLAANKDSSTKVSGQKAMAHVQALVALGDRRPGSEGHRKAQAYILAELRKAQVEVEEVNFDAETPRGRLAMKNIIAKIPGLPAQAGRSQDILVVGGHYDTLWRDGFVGANDGGSSAALLLELARALRRQAPLEKSVWVTFFDGEEAVESWSERDGVYGSRWQSLLWRQQGILKRVRAVIVVDMIGDRNLTIRREQNSTPWLTDLVWQAARDKGYAANFLNEETAVYDDHSAFLALGVPAVDLIDFDYGPQNRYWHTNQDTLDKVSPRSLAIVGDVVLEALNRLMQR